MLAIEDYGLIGNTLTAALVGRYGSIDWLCVPHFDSAACFAALLGTPENGRWLIAPEHAVTRCDRRYRGDTLVLETEMETETGAVLLLDFMPPPAVPGRADIVRLVVGLRGEVDMKTEIVLRFDYGRVVPWVRRRDGGLSSVAGPDAVQIRTPVPLVGRNFRTTGHFRVRAGDRVPFTFTRHASHEPPPETGDAEAMLVGTEAWWREWSAQARIEGEWRDTVMRSLIILKAMTFSPTGGIVAAATTSLPEALGGPRNWDYRFCWLRDATFTLFSLMCSGFHDEARAWRQWLLRAVAGDPAQMQIMYGLAGERRLTEIELPWLAGYADSRPVRIGNGAHSQFQLDVYGEVIGALHLARALEAENDDDAWRLQKVLLRFVEKVWREPDEGMWEIRGPRRHFTESKVMAWVAFDRAIDAVERFGCEGPVDHWRRIRAAIHADICEKGFSTARNSFVQSYGSSELDASLLLIPLVGFLPPDDPRIIGTVDAVQRELSADGMIIRYKTESDVDGLPPGEGAFIACSFWLVDNLVLLGRRDEALVLFERLLRLQNDLGMLPEEYDPVAKRHLGNVPQAFSHVALINSVSRLLDRQPPDGLGIPA